ncbi:MAG: MerC domain-containing protein [Armatimonadota bacterium]|nr:MerC domain-containing protein [Armatimonadota bacterium]
MQRGCPEGKHHGGRWDALGGGLSLLCAVHCLALPVLLPFAAAFAHSVWLEILLMLSAILVGGYALRHGFVRHGFRLPSWLFGSGMASIIFGNWVLTRGIPLASHSPGEHRQTAGSIAFVAIGGCLIVAAHILNYLWERRWVRSSHT